MAKNCLIGYTGFIGSNLKTQVDFDDFYNSKNIQDLKGNYDLVVCSAAPAVKWYANANPVEDYENIKLLIENLSSITCKEFILISTIDVYESSAGHDENSTSYDKTNAYGKHRRMLEEFVSNNFNHKIVRLPGMFGPGLKKNIIFDLLHNNQVEKINSGDEFQWYNVNNLWKDICEIPSTVKEINFFTEPISNEELVQKVFPEFLSLINTDKKLIYNNKSVHYDNGYILNKKAVIKQLIDYRTSF